MNGDSTETNRKQDIVVTRRFDAPVERVWKAWSDPQQVMRWWGPAGFTSPSARMDFREGGTSLVCMRSPDGQDYYNTWAYTQITPMRQFEFVQNAAGPSGEAIDPTSVGLPPDFPRDVRSLVTFRDLDGQTEMTVTEYGYESQQWLELSKMGLEQCLDKMAGSLKD